MKVVGICFILFSFTVPYCTGENCIVIVSGANMTLRPTDVQNAMELIIRSKVVICQLEIPQETSLEALRLAKKHNGMRL